jgi:hypothetical protein
MPDIVKDIERDIENCDKEGFERRAHQGQDWHSHRSGVQTDELPGGIRIEDIRVGEVGLGGVGVAIARHAVGNLAGFSPDDTRREEVRRRWEEAYEWTFGFVRRWHRNCCKYKGKWTRIEDVPGGKACCDKELEDSAAAWPTSRAAAEL